MALIVYMFHELILILLLLSHAYQQEERRNNFFVVVFFHGLKGYESEEFVPCMEAFVLLIRIYGCVYISVMLLEIRPKIQLNLTKVIKRNHTVI